MGEEGADEPSLLDEERADMKEDEACGGQMDKKNKDEAPGKEATVTAFSGRGCDCSQQRFESFRRTIFN